MKMYKFLNKGLKSAQNGEKWVIGKWKKVEGNISTCQNGYHASKEPLDAMRYVSGEIITQVEGRGKTDKQSDKTAFAEMRIVKARHWTKKDSVALSIFAAELSLANFEKVFPDDNRPRQAIEAARRWLKNPTKANESAARSAARSAESAAKSAARSAAWPAARSAAWSAAWSAARSAAWSAAWSAESAAWSAESAARSAAWSAARSSEKINKKINTWMKKHTKELEPIE